MCPASPCRNAATKKRTEQVSCIRSEKGSENWYSCFDPKISLRLIMFLWGSRRSHDQICLQKESRFSEFFLEFLFPDSIFLCSYFGAVERMQQSLINQYFLQTLFEKKSERRSPRGLFVCLYGCKLPRIWRENPLKSVVSISRDYWVYFDIAWTSSKYSECYF